MSYNSRRLTTSGSSRKRKDSEPYFPSTSSKPLVQQNSVSRPVSFTRPPTTSFRAEPQPQLSSNRLLAGCLAHEFLTKGTLLGQKFDPARAEAMPVSAAEVKRSYKGQGSGKAETSETVKPKPKPQSYAEVANLMRGDGAHVPGVVNPTQLAKWIQM